MMFRLEKGVWKKGLVLCQVESAERWQSAKEPVPYLLLGRYRWGPRVCEYAIYSAGSPHIISPTFPLIGLVSRELLALWPSSPTPSAHARRMLIYLSSLIYRLTIVNLIFKFHTSATWANSITHIELIFTEHAHTTIPDIQNRAFTTTLIWWSLYYTSNALFQRLRC